MSRRRAAVLALALVLYSPDVGADTWHLATPSTVQTDGGSNLRLPPGYFVDEPTQTRLDAEMRRLQEREVRLDAENKSLRKSAKSISFGWMTLSTVFVLGIAAGAYAAR